MKYALILVLIVVAGGAYYWYASTQQAPIAPEVSAPQEESEVNEDADVATSTATFTGTLEEVHEGCYYDAECYIVVDGKHVTVIRGWSREIVGSVRGVESFGDLNAHIGKELTVYAARNGNDYTLYGSGDYYVEVLKR